MAPTPRWEASIWRMNDWLTSGSLKIGGELILFLSSWNGLALVAFTGLLVWTTEAGCTGVGFVAPRIFPTMSSYNGFSMQTAVVIPVKYGVSGKT